MTDVAGTAMKGVGLYITAGIACETMRMVNRSHRKTSSKRTNRSRRRKR